MLTRTGRTPFAVLAMLVMGMAFTTSARSASAIEDVGRGGGGKSAKAVKQMQDDESDDDDDESFFSSPSRRTVAAASPATMSASAAPSVDVTATCRAVLADNLSYYNWNFIEGCKRAIARR